MDATLKQEDQYIRSRFMQQQSSEYFVVQGRTLADLEQHEQQLLAELAPLATGWKLDAAQALGSGFHRLEQQKRMLKCYRRFLSRLWWNMRQAFTAQRSRCFKLASAFKRPTVADRSGLLKIIPAFCR